MDGLGGVYAHNASTKGNKLTYCGACNSRGYITDQMSFITLSSVTAVGVLDFIDVMGDWF